MTRSTRLAVTLAACAAAAVFVVLYARLWPYLIDDAYISMRYASHLAHGHGLVYNVGERVEGYTNFLWTVGLVIPHLVGFDPVRAIKIADLVLVLATAWALIRLARASVLSPEALRSPAPVARRAKPVARGAARGGEAAGAPAQDRGAQSIASWLAVAPALIYLATPQIAVTAAEGLETTLFGFLLVLALAWFFEEQAPGRFPRSAVALAALALTRPDGAPFGLFLLGCAAALRRPRPYLLRFAAIFIGTFAAYFALRWLYYGDPLPNTLYAKGGGTWFNARVGFDEVKLFAPIAGGWVLLAMLAALATRRPARGAAWLLAGVILLRMGFQIWSGGPYLGRFRFMVPAIPFIDLMVVAGIVTLVRSPRARPAAVAAAAVLLLIPGWLAYPRVEARDLKYAAGLQRAQIPLGLDVRAHTLPDAVMAMDDAGAGPYLAERTNIDMLGLNDRHIAHLPGHYTIKSDPAYVLARAPDLIVLVSKVPEPEGPNDFQLLGHARLFVDPTFRARYRPERRYTFGPDYYLIVFRRLDSTQVPAGL